VYDVYQALLNTQLEQGKQAHLTRTGQIVNIKQLSQHGMALIMIQEPAPAGYSVHPEDDRSWPVQDFRLIFVQALKTARMPSGQAFHVSTCTNTQPYQLSVASEYYSVDQHNNRIMYNTWV